MKARLQSQITLNTYGAAVREVIQNSIDAGASQIDIKLDLSSLSFWVKDDGVGIPPDELERICQRYFTTKLRRLEDLTSIKTFGFRGEALHSLVSMSNLTIVSKRADFNSSYITRFTGDGNSNIALPFDMSNREENPVNDFFYFEPFRSSGTIVTASSLFQNIPVRRNNILRLPEYNLLHEVKEVVLKSLIDHPNVRITVWKLNKGSQTSKQVLKVNRVFGNLNWYSNLLTSIYGSSLLPTHEVVNASFKDIKMHGVIGIQPNQSRKYQYISINGRLVQTSEEDSNTINKIFVGCNFGGQQLNLTDFTDHKKRVSSVGKPFSKYPVFLINFECQTQSGDLLQDPSKTIVHPRQWRVLFKMLNKVFISFLKHAGYDLQLNRKVISSPTPSPTKRMLEEPTDILPLKRSSAASRFILNSNSRFGSIKPDEIRGILLNSDRPGYFYKPVNFIKSSKTNESHLTASISCHLHKCSEDDDIRRINTMSEYPDAVDLENISLKKECLHEDNCRVVLQLYKKFILVVIESEGTKNLMIIDQHACDERIKVENLYMTFLHQVYDTDLRVKLAQPFDLSVPGEEIEYLTAFRPNFNSFGIDFETHETDGRVHITHLPELLIGKIANDAKFLRASILQHVWDLALHRKSAKLTGSPADWFQKIKDLPSIIMEVINSKACRSAIMFGDLLEMKDMQNMVKSLHRCQLPFQCAHGRPTITPLVDLSKQN